MGNIFLTSSVAFLFGTFLQMFLKVDFLRNLLAGFGAVLFGSYLAYDTQMIIGGKHISRQYGQNEYILAALNLYQDAVNLFIQIMKIIGKEKKSHRSS